MYASELLDAGMEPTWAHERRFQLHRKKLQQIRGRSLVPVSQPVSATRTSLPRLKAPSFLEAERQEAIKRENALLMQKLVTIAEGKKLRKARRSLEPRSLNEYLRKKEEDRIKAENDAFSRRLMEKAGEISKRQLDLSFFESQRYKRQISKTQILKSQLKGIRPNPLTDSDSEAKGNGSAGEQLTKRSPKAYQRPNELSPLNRTVPAMELAALQETAMDTKGEIAVLVDGKKTKRRAKGLNETTEGRVQGKQLQTSVLSQPLSKRTIEQSATESTARKPVPPAPKSTTDKVTPKKSPVRGKEQMQGESTAENALSEQPALSPVPLQLPEKAVSPLAEERKANQTLETVKEETPNPPVSESAEVDEATAFKPSPQEPPPVSTVPEAAELPKSSAEEVAQPSSVEQADTNAGNQAPVPVPETEVAAVSPPADPQPVQEALQTPLEEQSSA